MALIDVASWTPAPNVYAWRHPNRELNTKSQLIVSEGQEAVLLNEGRAFGPFGPGRHVLNTANYPFLSGLIKIVTGGAAPFPAEVWFVSKATKLDVKWGTNGAIQVEDPKYHIILPVRAFGQYGLVVEDSNRFLLKLVGMIPAFTAGVLSDYFKGIVIMHCKDLIAKCLVEKNISVLQMSAHLNEIAENVERSVAEILAGYGVRLTNFTILSISTDEEDPSVKQLRKALATKAEMDIVGYTYQQKRSFDTMETAAGNTGNGNMMNAGMGMGMGMGIGVGMGNVMGGMAANLQTAPTKKCPACGKDIDANAAFCPFCGGNSAAPQSKGIICDKCGKTAPEGNKFCPFCGDEFCCCPECGTDNAKGAVHCRSCGKKLIAAVCPGCGAEVADGAKFCGSCGYKMIRNCVNCGAQLAPGAKFCPECGTKSE